TRPSRCCAGSGTQRRTRRARRSRGYRSARRGLSRLWHSAKYGRLAQLVAEYPQRTTAAGAALLYCSRARGAWCAAPARGAAMSERYPGYDVLAKRHTPSWNEKTRRVIDQRLALPRGQRFFSEEEWRVLQSVCARIVPQPSTRAPVPIAAMIDAQLHE